MLLKGTNLKSFIVDAQNTTSLKTKFKREYLSLVVYNSTNLLDSIRPSTYKQGIDGAKSRRVTFKNCFDKVQ